jgi:hypothetical protein
MTLRMVMQQARSESVLTLHGWLSGPEVAEFVRVVDAAQLPLQIDLTHLVGVDPSGIEALSSLRVRGARLVNASPYINLLLATRDQACPGRGGRGGSSDRD